MCHKYLLSIQVHQSSMHPEWHLTILTKLDLCCVIVRPVVWRRLQAEACGCVASV